MTIKELISLHTPGEWKPARITLELSENGAFYHTCITVHAADCPTNEASVKYIKCKSSVASVNNLDVLCALENEEPSFVAITMSEGSE